MRTREDYENLINNSRLFEIDKASSNAEYKAEHYSFLTELTDYYRFYIYRDKPLDSYSMVLVETAVECIKYYDKSKGEFLHLFNKVMKRNLGIECAKKKIDEQRQGIKLAERDAMLIRKIIAFADSKNLDITDIEVQKKMAVVLDLPLATVSELININYNATAIPSMIINDDGDEIELYDLIADNRACADEDALAESALCDAVDKIERIFTAIQERQKQIISMLLTVEFIKAFDGEVHRAERLLRGRAMFSSKVVELYKEKGEVPTVRIISALCGVSEQSANRTYKNFREKLRLSNENFR